MRDTASILPLVLEDVSFEAGGRRLIDHVSLEIPRGGMMAVIGPNGAGKSLLLRLCHGLLAPRSGAVRFASPEGAIAGRKRHAMVFQRPVMLRRSLRANLDHALAATGHPGDRDARVEEAMQRFGLHGLAASPARLLSGGEQQRLAIARAWAMAPELIFLDEPTSQLDPGATRQIEAMLAMLESEGTTLVMATHDLGQARRLARHIVFLDKGRLVEAGRADDFFSGPRSAEARAFLAGDLLW